MNNIAGDISLALFFENMDYEMHKFDIDIWSKETDIYSIIIDCYETKTT